MKTTFLPQTKQGKNTVQLGFILLVLFATIQLVANMQGPGAAPNVTNNNPVAGITKIGTVIVAIITFLTGSIAIFKSQERSILVYIFTLLSFLLLALKEILVV